MLTATILLWMAMQAQTAGQFLTSGTSQIPLCDAPNLAPHTTCLVLPEPMDVPAVQDGDGRWTVLFGDCAPTAHMEMKVENHLCMTRAWTCADKSRVLLQSEDGVRHCVLFKFR